MGTRFGVYPVPMTLKLIAVSHSINRVAIKLTLNLKHRRTLFVYTNASLTRKYDSKGNSRDSATFFHLGLTPQSVNYYFRTIYLVLYTGSCRRP